MDVSLYGAEPMTPMSLTESGASGASGTSGMRRPLLALLTGGLCFASIASVHKLGTGATGGPMTDEAVNGNGGVSLAAKLKRPNARAEYEYGDANSLKDESYLSKSEETGSQTRPSKKAKAEVKSFSSDSSAGAAGSKTYTKQSFGFVADSDYSRRDGATAGAQYNFGYPLVEPYRITTLSVTDSLSGASNYFDGEGGRRALADQHNGSPRATVGARVEAQLADSNRYRWRIAATDGSSSSESLEWTASLDANSLVDSATTATSLEVTFTSPGWYAVFVDEFPANSNRGAGQSNAPHRSYQSKVVCRYVRREIRALFPEDQSLFFDTLEIMYRTSWGEGQAKYGNVWRNAGVFARDHNNLAAQRECDHMHDGLGFLTAHGALTLDFEKAMQMVDPSISIPYWDFTIDAQAASESGSIKSWYDSEIFDKSFFGSVATDATNGHVVEEGRWAYVPVNMAAYGINGSQAAGNVLNAYGHLRAPWNTNSASFLTRHNQTSGYTQSSPPSCEWHYEQLQFTDWALFGREIQYEPHGKIHTMVAGVWGNKQDHYWEEMGFEARIGASIAMSSFGFQKDLWRRHWMQCPEACSSDADTDTCKCSCSPILSELRTSDNREMAATDVLQAVDGSTFSDAESHLNADGEERSFEILELMCDSYDDTHTMIGDLGNSGGPIDPLFWPVHPTIDRLWHWRRLNGMDDESWPSDAKHTYFHDVYGKDGSVEAGGSCYGHGPDDVMSWRNLFDTDDHYYTNRELYNYLAPGSEELPYIYDSFLWPHCVSEGYSADLNSKLETAKPQQSAGDEGDDDEAVQVCCCSQTTFLGIRCNRKKFWIEICRMLTGSRLATAAQYSPHHPRPGTAEEDEEERGHQ
mmetsp:Transcript_109923/g.319886  ORF Transcript_109923/g.319886 Transcript_109923/m.319886 type:complete len:864 (+) Transcript_109923:2-2593(+)